MSSVLALDGDETSFWTNDGCLKRVDIATGVVLSNTCCAGTAGLTLVGEPRAAFLAASAGDIPTLSEWWLIFLAVTVVAVAIGRLR